VKILIDENLSRRLVARFADLYPGSIHVTAVSLAESPDAEVWEYAKANEFTILAADADVFELTLWLRAMEPSTGDAEMYSDEKRFGLPSLRLALSWVCL